MSVPSCQTGSGVEEMVRCTHRLAQKSGTWILSYSHCQCAVHHGYITPLSRLLFKIWNISGPLWDHNLSDPSQLLSSFDLRSIVFWNFSPNQESPQKVEYIITYLVFSQSFIRQASSEIHFYAAFIFLFILNGKILYTLAQYMEESRRKNESRGQQAPLVEDEVGTNECGLFKLCGWFQVGGPKLEFETSCDLPNMSNEVEVYETLMLW